MYFDIFDKLGIIIANISSFKNAILLQDYNCHNTIRSLLSYYDICLEMIME